MGNSGTTPTTTLPTTSKKTTFPTTTPTTTIPTSKRTTSVPVASVANRRWSCNFEGSNGGSDWCGLQQDEFDDFDWTIQTGKTPSEETGPDQAYEGNYYIYIEASKPRETGDKAT